VRVAALSVLGSLYGQLAHYDRADAILEESLALSRGLGDTFRMSDTLGRLGWLTINRSDFVRAKAHFEESLAIAQESGHRLLVASALAGLGSTAVEGGDFERARRLSERALKIERELGSHSSVGLGSINRGFLELALGNFERATAIAEEGLALGRRSGNKVVIAGCLHILGLIEAQDADPTRGQRLLAEALEITAEVEYDRDIAESLEGIAATAGALGQRARAARLWGAAESFRRTQDQPWYSVERMVYEPLLEAARTHTDPSVWDPAFAKGKAMGLEQAVQYALSEAKPAIATPEASDQPAVHAQPLLTSREEEVATLVGKGLTNRQIASELSVSEHTAATHVGRILKKLGLQSRAQVGSWLREQRPPTADLT
jgi:DNA-binding CsgD family transcriptional regulator